VHPAALGRAFCPAVAPGDAIVVVEAACAALGAPGLVLEGRALASRSPALLAFAPDPTVEGRLPKRPSCWGVGAQPPV
jgi:hypothetical protein